MKRLLFLAACLLLLSVLSMQGCNSSQAAPGTPDKSTGLSPNFYIKGQGYQTAK